MKTTHPRPTPTRTSTPAHSAGPAAPHVTREARRFVERMGLAAETDGYSRIAGRLFGVFLLSAEPRSLDELVALLGVSKASVSIDGRRLLEQGIVERVSKPGDRRDYYQLAPDFFVKLLQRRAKRWTTLRDLAADARDQLPDQPPVVHERLAYMETMSQFVLGVLDGAMREWQERIARESTSARPPRPRTRSPHRT